MPTYSYECQSCKHVFDSFQYMSEDPLKDCPKCEEKSTLKRLIGPGAGFIFKGEGFYITDYRSKSYKDKAKSESGSSSSSSSSETSNTSSTNSSSASSSDS
ncbi:FmdB family zinc ribbon protein [Candidatus Uabimicrobium sp. HlEnr_7]|uniref:FmdB family zinc ribbon protein n=1 Tax=Candidatus Uabimicrobium helgolandensis TaxID=3095367 RepID=UPI0035592662